MKEVEKKILPQFFKDVLTGRKTFEIRKDDDGVEVGDVLVLREYDGEKYTGKRVKRVVTYVLRDCAEYGLMDGFAVYGIQQMGFDGTFVQTGNNETQIGTANE